MVGGRRVVAAVLVTHAVLLPVAAQYGAMQVTTFPNGVTNNPAGEPPGSIPLAVDPTSGRATSWVASSAATPAVLATATSSQCQYIEGAFEDGFQYTNLNLTRWKPILATTLDHCPKPGAVGAANPQTCTAMLNSQMQFGVPLPGHPTGDLGLIMTLSQTPCATAGACCVSGQCANWAGAHLSSLGCVHYGVLETEAAFNIPPASGGVFFAGTYMYGGALDPSWNEIDQTFINGAFGLEFHGSLFLSNPPYQSSASEDKDVFDATGTSCNSYAPPVGQAGNLKGTHVPYTCPLFSTTMAASYHTYKLIWTPTWLAWTVDTTVYRNSTAAPWRPVTMRPLLRTNVGTAASVAALPDAQVYIRRVRYTPLDAAGMVVKNALTCVSMAACFGNLANNAAGILQLSTPGMASASGRRRQLLQVGPTLDVNGAVLSTPTAAVVVTPYLQELQSVSNATQFIVASVLPGVLPSQVMVTITGHTISGIIYATGFSYAQWSATAQAAFVRGLADDVLPTPDQVYVSSVLDASLPVSWASVVGASSPMPSGASGALISYTVDGYTCAAVVPSSTTAPCVDAGFTLASTDVAVLNSLGASSAVTRALSALLPAVTLSDVSAGTPAEPNWPTIAATVGVGINIFSSANATAGPAPTDLVEAMFDSALSSGIISAALSAAGIGSASAPSNVQTARATRAADAASGCPLYAPLPVNDPFVVCPNLLKAADTYKSVMIAFIVGFTVMVVGFLAGIMFMHARTRALERREAYGRIPPMMPQEPVKGAHKDVLGAF